MSGALLDRLWRKAEGIIDLHKGIAGVADGVAEEALADALPICFTKPLAQAVKVLLQTAGGILRLQDEPGAVLAVGWQAEEWPPGYDAGSELQE